LQHARRLVIATLEAPTNCANATYSTFVVFCAENFSTGS